MTRPSGRASSGSTPAALACGRRQLERGPLRAGRTRAARLRGRPEAPRHVESRHGTPCAWPQRASRCRASSSAAATSAASARRPRSSARVRPRAEAHALDGCRLGSRDHERSTPPTLTAAAAANRSSAAGFGRRAPRCASGSSSRRRRSTRWPRATTAASRAERIRRQIDGKPDAPRRRQPYLSTSPTRWIRTCRSPRRSAAFDELVDEGKIQAYGGSNVDAAWLEEALRHGRPDWAQNSYSLLEREDEQEAIR